MSTNRRSTLRMTTTSIRIGSQPIVITKNLKKEPENPLSLISKEVTVSPIEISDTDSEKTDCSKSPVKKITSYPIPKYDVKSKVGSKDNIKHRPGGGDTNSEKAKHGLKNKVAPRIVTNTKSLPTAANTQKENDVKRAIRSEKISFNARRISLVSPPTSPRINLSHVKSKIGSLDNIKHKPSGGTKKVFDENVEQMREKIASKANSKVGSLDNIKHKPGGGKKQIYDDKREFIKSKEIKSKVGSLENIKHKPGGGEKKIYDDKLEFIKSKEIKSKVGSLDNINHKPGGGSVKIYDDKFEFIKSKEITSRVGSLDNIKHKPGGGDLQIFDDKLAFIKSKDITSKVGSLENINHKPGGGDLLIYNERLTFKTVSSPRIDAGKKNSSGSLTLSSCSPRSELSSEFSSEDASTLSSPSIISQI